MVVALTARGAGRQRIGVIGSLALVWWTKIETLAPWLVSGRWILMLIMLVDGTKNTPPAALKACFNNIVYYAFLKVSKIE